MLDWIDDINWTDLLLQVGNIAIRVIAIVILYFIVKSIGTRAIRKVFNRKQDEMNLGRAKTLESITQNIFTYFLLFIFAGFIFSIFQFDITTLLAGAGIVGLAIGFGAQGLVSDVVTGFFILLEQQIDVGDYVTVAGKDGVVEEVGLRTTKLRGMDGTLHFVPNREITNVSNHSRGNMRALVDIGISYDDDIDKATQILQQVCERIAVEDENIVEGPDVIGVQAFGASEVVLRVIAKTKNGEQWAVERNLRKAMKEAFDQNGIEIPFPHQVHINKNA
ncbi:mechanosensitive ion channel family protein [Ornithinibacillus massiliensis]|uniref:Mechanosensitive ion channel family protein n=1 Tax=Ornithinibacillus massiliensis TaxID=1944633 RepID=A0ABS5MEK9_9BACI|nr:mechanosensitive ion channel family protein [Ornithinibacillus massiliensis]MBS3680342.1 mechanosensitive ion channel family protein [Ornithinibacillus massiliensis]